jgi:hypothetical protein
MCCKVPGLVKVPGHQKGPTVDTFRRLLLWYWKRLKSLARGDGCVAGRPRRVRPRAPEATGDEAKR